MFNISDKTLTDRQRRIYDFLSGNHVGVLATVDPNADPHGSVIYYVVGKNFTVSFVTRTGTKKYDNLILNNHVMLVIFQPDSQTVAQVIGKAVEIKKSNDINAVAAAVFKARLNVGKDSALPITKLEAGAYAAFRIEPDQIRMAAYARPDSAGYNHIFESIESFDLNDN